MAKNVLVVNEDSGIFMSNPGGKSGLSVIGVKGPGMCAMLWVKAEPCQTASVAAINGWVILLVSFELADQG